MAEYHYAIHGEFDRDILGSFLNSVEMVPEPVYNRGNIYNKDHRELKDIYKRFALGLRKSGFLTLFKAFILQILLNLMKDPRKDKAEQYLLTTDISVGEIADVLGFSSFFIFSQILEYCIVWI